MTILGSPPQVRGKQFIVFGNGVETRITPAGAGKTLRADPAERRCRDHPRRCGENVLYRFLCSLFQGSPPQVRGKLIHIPPSSQGKRITPAGAGKTIPYRFLCWDFWDHPRRCGENVHRMRPSTRMPGSPPQVRGKPHHLILQPFLPRITPAGAGKTRNTIITPTKLTDHPRRCGENACGGCLRF